MNLPSNDIAFGYPVLEQITNHDIIRSLAAAVPVWFTTSQPRNLNQAGRDSLISMFVTTLALYGDFAIDFWTGIAEPNGEIRGEFDEGDGIHLNDAAHGILFERVMAEGIQDIRVLAVEPMGPATPLTLLPAHPQPARGPVTLRFTLDRAMDVTLGLYDVRGRHLATLQHGYRPAGFHHAQFDTSLLPGGVYFAVLRGENGARAARRVAVIR